MKMKIPFSHVRADEMSAAEIQLAAPALVALGFARGWCQWAPRKLDPPDNRTLVLVWLSECGVDTELRPQHLAEVLKTGTTGGKYWLRKLAVEGLITGHKKYAKIGWYTMDEAQLAEVRKELEGA